MKFLAQCFLICCVIANVCSFKVLVVTSMPAYSHYTLAYRLAKELSDRNHEVLFINPFPDKPQTKNFKSIYISEAQEFIKECKARLFYWDSFSLLEMINEEIDIGVGITELTFKNLQVQELLKSNQAFDVVIVEHFLNEALIGLGQHFKAPVILLEPVAPSVRSNYFFANPGPTSYIPNLASSFTSRMTFWQRVKNFIDSYLYKASVEIMYVPHQRAIFKKYFNTELELDDVAYNVSLMLTTSHPSVNDPIPNQANVIEIGGYHVSPPQALPPHLQKYLDDARKGVILFSLGSNLNSKDLTPDVRNAILKSFSKIKEKVLWKFEAELPKAPKNVKIMKWLPQQDVIAHPNIRAFITHGGLLGTIEAIYYGVPVIGIPVFGDQHNNVAITADHECGVGLSLKNFTEEKFSAALNEILTNPKYRENARKRSNFMRDQPLTPIDNAIFWVEFVSRHKGAPHMRSKGLDLHWWQRASIDVVAFFLFALFVEITIVVLVVGVLKKVLSSIFPGKKQKSVDKSKKIK